MRVWARVILGSLVVSAGLGLAACDTVDRLQDAVTGLFDREKKLPGERKAVFPEGVPGVTQGVPPEYLRENRQQEPDPTELAKPEEPQPPAPETQSAPRQRPARTAKPVDITPPDANEAPRQRPAARPQRQTPETAQQPRRTAIPPAEPVNPAPAPAPAPAAAPQVAPAPSRSAPLPWPTAPPPGSFSR